MDIYYLGQSVCMVTQIWPVGVQAIYTTGWSVLNDITLGQSVYMVTQFPA